MNDDTNENNNGGSGSNANDNAHHYYSHILRGGADIAGAPRYLQHTPLHNVVMESVFDAVRQNDLLLAQNMFASARLQDLRRARAEGDLQTLFTAARSGDLAAVQLLLARSRKDSAATSTREGRSSYYYSVHDVDDQGDEHAHPPFQPMFTPLIMTSNTMNDHALHWNVHRNEYLPNHEFRDIDALHLTLRGRRRTTTTTQVPLLTQSPPVGGGWTALHYSCYGGHVPVVRLLLDHGADLEAPTLNDFQDRPLHVACRKGAVSVVQELLTRGANIEARNYSYSPTNHYSSFSTDAAQGIALRDDFGTRKPGNVARYTPLQIAVSQGHVQVFQDLIRHGASVRVRDDFLDGQNKALLTTADSSSVSRTGDSLLHLAVRSGQLEMVNAVLQTIIKPMPKDQQVAAVNDRNFQGETPLHCLMALVTLIHDCHKLDQFAQDCFKIALKIGEELLQYGAFPIAHGSEERTPLHMSCAIGDVAFLRQFLNHMTATSLAPSRGSIALSSFPLCHVLDDQSNTPLHVACHEGNLQAVQELLSSWYCHVTHFVESASASSTSFINLPNQYGDSPLHAACKAAVASRGTVQELLSSDQGTRTSFCKNNGN